ncbi:TPA: winged helix-turn-helix domain-containing protein [Serratia marcescens]
MGVNQFIAQGIMRYIINNNIKYHEDRSELISLYDDIPPIVLTATLNRLLSALVRNNNLVLSRETLLMQVWEVHGQVASGNNLNNTISMLRKMFASLGEEEIIVTLPRQGFMFCAKQLNTIDDESSLDDKPVPAIAVQPPPSKRGWLKRKILLAVLSVVAVLTLAWAMFSPEHASITYKSIGVVDKCDIRAIGTYHLVKQAYVNLPGIAADIKRFGLDCSLPATIYYYSSSTLHNNRDIYNSVSFVAYCPAGLQKNPVSECENFYETKDVH